MALSISHSMGPEVSIPSVAWSCWGGSVQLHPCVCWPLGMRDHRTECTSGPCASIGEDTSESFDLRLHGISQRANSDSSIQEISLPPRAPLLGQSLLGQWVLRGHNRARCRDDTKIHNLSREKRARTRQKINRTRGQLSVPSKKARNDAPLRGAQGFSRRLLLAHLGNRCALTMNTFEMEWWKSLWKLSRWPAKDMWQSRNTAPEKIGRCRSKRCLMNAIRRPSKFVWLWIIWP
jgi:hypothetical protein